MSGQLLEYIITITAAAMVCTLMEYLFPKGSLKSSVRIGTGIVFLLVISTPLVASCTNNNLSAVIPEIPAINTAQLPRSHYEWLKELYEKQGMSIE